MALSLGGALTALKEGLILSSQVARLIHNTRPFNLEKKRMMIRSAIATLAIIGATLAPLLVQAAPKSADVAECKQLEKSLESIAEQEKKALPPQQQDALTKQKRTARDRQSELKC